MRRVLCLGAPPRLPWVRCATARLQLQLQQHQRYMSSSSSSSLSSSSSDRTLKYAVLIDADCCEHTKVQLILNEIIAMGGNPSVRRAYGDFAMESNHPWKITCQHHSIVPIQAFVSSTWKKASTDSAVTIDAMDLLHTNTTLDGFVLITGDSDFGRLAQRLREAGKHVVGVGQETTSEAFVQSCDHFIRADELEFPKIDDEEEEEDEVVEEEEEEEVNETEKSDETTETVVKEPENHETSWIQRVRGLWTGLPLIAEPPSTAPTPTTSESLDTPVPKKRKAKEPAESKNGGAAIAANAESNETGLIQTLSSYELLFFHVEVNALADDDDEFRWVSLSRVDRRVAYRARDALPDFSLRERGYASYIDMFRNYPHEFEVLHDVENSDQFVRSLRFEMEEEEEEDDDDEFNDDDDNNDTELSVRQEVAYFHELLNAADADRDDGWVLVSFLGDYMAANRPDFSARKLGFKGILHMLQQYPDEFEFYKVKDTWRVRSLQRSF